MYRNDNLLKFMLSAAVPLRIIAMVEKGGPDADDKKRAQEAASDLLGEKGDLLLCVGGKEGEAAKLFNGLAHIIAVLSFCPGGVTTFGQTFDGNKYMK